MYPFIATIALALIYLGLLCDAKPVNVTMPSQCAGQYFCKDKHPDYPTKIINSLLKDRITSYTKHISVDDRYGPDDGSEERICASEEDFLPIFEIIDEEGNLRFVVQSEKKLTQTVRTEICLNPGQLKNTDLFTAQNLNDYNITCEQKYIYYKFLVLTLDKQGFELVGMKNGVPVGCYCRVLERSKL